MYLEITEQGFVVSGKGLFRKYMPKMLPWADIQEFGILEIGFLQYVSYQFTKESGRKRGLGGYVIPIIFEAPTEDVTILLEGLRQGSLQGNISGLAFHE